MRRLIVCCLFALGLAGCFGQKSIEGEWYTSWDREGACQGPGPHEPWGVSAAGAPLGPCQGHAGRWLWVLYVADWCSASGQQAGEAAQAFRAFPDNVARAVVVTSGREVFSPATAADVQRWAQRLGLGLDRAVGEGGDSARTVPQHLLLGPDGRTAYRYVGVLFAEEMQRILDDFQSGRRIPDPR